MQLRVARLCLDCEEIHDAQQCPICGSESFAFISRWVQAPERRARPRPNDHAEEARPGRSSERAREDAETYRQLLAPERAASNRMRWVRRGAFGMAAVGVAQWLWRRTQADDRSAGGVPGPSPDDE